MPSSDDVSEAPQAKRLKRSYVACRRCHSHKIKCSGDTPCRSCKNSNNSENCTYPVRDRKVVVPESYLKKLEAQSQSDARPGAPPPYESLKLTSCALRDESSRDPFNMRDSNVSNPLVGKYARIVQGNSSVQPVYVGSSACIYFGACLQQYISGHDYLSRPPRQTYYDHPRLLRLTNTEHQLPSRTYARMLVQVVNRFIGMDYHLLLRKSYMQKLDETYAGKHADDPAWLANFFSVLALGELYSKRVTTFGTGQTVPGTGFFLKAMDLYEDLYEEATLTFIETTLLISFYSHALNRTNAAYTYAGLALRLGLTLGLHRDVGNDRIMSAVEREHRRRVFWTSYVFDRLCSSTLGHPIMIRDKDIDTPLPSMDGLNTVEQEEFSDPAHLVANVRLAEIVGKILTDIYSIPSAGRERSFVQCVHDILTRLREWDASLPTSLKLDPNKSPPYRARPVASLHLQFNQCIISTTRPVLFHYFKILFHPAGRNKPHADDAPSPMTTALSEACIQAARATVKILTQLWIDGAIATYGYFDAHYIFSSTIIIMMSNILKPNSADCDAAESSFNLLKSMADDGNVPARQYCQCLSQINKDIASIENNTKQLHVQNGVCKYEPIHDDEGGEKKPAKEAQHQFASSPFTLAQPQHAAEFAEIEEAGIWQHMPQFAAPLDDPLLQDFLSTQPGSQWNALNIAFDASTPWEFELEDARILSNYQS